MGLVDNASLIDSHDREVLMLRAQILPWGSTFMTSRNLSHP